MALNVSVKVHPIVLFQIVDSFERRKDGAARVIGTLLGVTEPGCVEITNCFSVPHNEDDEEVAVELDFAKDMYDLNKKVNPSDSIVGWYATGHAITEHSVLIHEYYSRECTNPIHLTLDTSLQNGKMDIKAFISVVVGTQNGTKGTLFTPVPLEYHAYEPEAVGVGVTENTKLSSNRSVELKTDLNLISKESNKLGGMLDDILAYVDDVLDGETAPDSVVGRKLLKLVQLIPSMTSDQFDEMLNANVRDLLMVIYLSQLTKTHLSLNEKLTLLASNN